MKSLLVSILIAGLFLVSCKKESFITGADAALSVSSDSLYFDTVFTTTGSITQFFRIYNENNQKLRLSSVRLSGGTTSYFKINVDGTAGPEVNNIEINANDSVYVFVSVKIDPNGDNLPFIIQDSISIQYNGNEQKVKLSAWGQNAHFLRSSVISGNEAWTNDKPYVILGGLQVDTNATLTINEGCRIYMHADAPIVVDGTLQVFGTEDSAGRVTFRGDRLDDPYRYFPAGWPGIYFRGESKDNILRYAEIKNAYQGLVAIGPSINSEPKLKLEQCIVDNCYDAGVFGIGSDIVADNCLLSNNGKNLLLVYGGNYTFTHCTVVSYGNLFLQHKDPVLYIANYVEDGNSVLTADLDAHFRNCIFWGENGTTENEVVTDKRGNSNTDIVFENCLWKVKDIPENIDSATSMILNQPPQFDSVNNQLMFYNFRLKANSPALNAGISTPLPSDLDGKPRNVGGPDLGSYERQN